MDSRRIPGEGVEHEQDYIEERLEDAGDVDELEAQSRKLREEARDLQHLDQGLEHPAGQSNPQGLPDEAQVGDGRMQMRPQGAQLEPSSRSGVDLDQLPPEAEARSRVTQDLDQGYGSSTRGPRSG